MVIDASLSLFGCWNSSMQYAAINVRRQGKTTLLSGHWKCSLFSEDLSVLNLKYDVNITVLL